eukprot:TRINITY_DN3577_c0_g2_i3.p2 TRINITY_DN3577_c0_g2~~TRINITY_DN3577_c0_g2_i3.p2  ORF type:complete len:235 (+),score=66.40 TRINITY_DN3577_c0_g2_i3:161-865(+)
MVAGAAAEGNADPMAMFTQALDGMRAAQDHLLVDDSPEAASIRDQIVHLNSSLSAYNAQNAEKGVVLNSTKLRVHFDAGKDLNDKPGGAVNLEFRCKPGTTDSDIGKLTGRLKALFMAVPKPWKHLMNTSQFEHPDGFKRWSIEIKFPFTTIDKVLKSVEAFGDKERAIFGHVKAYLEKAKEFADCVPFHSGIELAWDAGLLEMFNYFDATGAIRKQLNAAAGPDAQIEKRVAK